MEFEAVDEGTIAQILVAEGTDNVKVGTMIAVIAGEDEDASEAKAAPAPAPAAAAPAPTPQPARAEPVEAPSSPPTETKKDSPSTSSGQTEKGNRVKARSEEHTSELQSLKRKPDAGIGLTTTNNTP